MNGFFLEGIPKLAGHLAAFRKKKKKRRELACKERVNL